VKGDKQLEWRWLSAELTLRHLYENERYLLLFGIVKDRMAISRDHAIVCGSEHCAQKMCGSVSELEGQRTQRRESKEDRMLVLAGIQVGMETAGDSGWRTSVRMWNGSIPCHEVA
jgi:hypothetical protein